MANTIGFKVSGLKELQDKLERLPLKASKRIMRTGLLAAVEIWLREMEARVARRTGFLARNIIAKVRIKSDLSATAEVGPTSGAFRALFIEFGTKKMAAQPFIRPAFESRKQDVLDEFAIEVKAALEHEGLKLQ